MTIHTMAYSNFSQGYDPTYNRASLDGVRDQAVTLSAQRRPIFSQEMSVVGAYAIHPELVSAQIDAPTLRRIVSPYIVPITASDQTPSDPNAMCLLPSPWTIGRQEEIGVTVTVKGQIGSTPNSPQVLLWLADRLEQVPRGDNYWIRYVKQDDFNDSPVTSDSWTSVNVVFDQTLAAGRYAVIGFQHQCNGLLCARLIFDNQVFRPGTIAVPLTDGEGYDYGRPSGARTAPMFYDGSLGVLGYFDSYAPPRIEVLGLNSGGFNTNQDHEGYLRIVRVDAGTAGSPGPSGLALPSRTYG